MVLFAVLPVLTLVTMLAVGLSDDSLSADFHHEIYPQAKEMLEGHNPVSARPTSTRRRLPTSSGRRWSPTSSLP